jgi:hypothetical protein
MNAAPQWIEFPSDGRCASNEGSGEKPFDSPALIRYEQFQL